MPRTLFVFVVVSTKLSLTSPLGDAVETFIRREDAERFIEEVRATIPSLRATCGSRSETLTLEP